MFERIWVFGIPNHPTSRVGTWNGSTELNIPTYIRTILRTFLRTYLRSYVPTYVPTDIPTWDRVTQIETITPTKLACG